MADSHITLPKSKAQMRILDQIGCGNLSPIMAKATRDAMVRAGLIQPLPDRVMGSGAFAVRIEEFQMPIPVHMLWCTSASEEDDGR